MKSKAVQQPLGSVEKVYWTIGLYSPIPNKSGGRSAVEMVRSGVGD